MLVSGPTGIRATGSGARSVSAISSTAPRLSGSKSASGILRPVHTALAVDVLGRAELAQRPRGAGGDGDVGAPDQGQDAQRVARGLRERRVAGDRGHGQQVQPREPQAIMRATASSWPGSTSRITGFGLTRPPLDSVPGQVSRFSEARVQRGRQRPAPRKYATPLTMRGLSSKLSALGSSRPLQAGGPGRQYGAYGSRPASRVRRGGRDHAGKPDRGRPSRSPPRSVRKEMARGPIEHRGTRGSRGRGRAPGSSGVAR